MIKQNDPRALDRSSESWHMKIEMMYCRDISSPEYELAMKMGQAHVPFICMQK